MPEAKPSIVVDESAVWTAVFAAAFVAGGHLGSLASRRDRAIVRANEAVLALRHHEVVDVMVALSDERLAYEITHGSSRDE